MNQKQQLSLNSFFGSKFDNLNNLNRIVYIQVEVSLFDLQFLILFKTVGWVEFIYIKFQNVKVIKFPLKKLFRRSSNLTNKKMQN